MNNTIVPIEHTGHQPQRHEHRDDDQIVLRIWFSRLNSQGSIDAYSYAYRLFREHLGDKPLVQVTAEDLMNFRDSLSGAQSTRRNRWDAISSLFRVAFETGYIRYNPAVAIRQRRQKKGDLVPKTLPHEEILRMIRLEPSDRNRAVLTVMYYAGIRISEVTHLRWRDIVVGHPNSDFDGYLSVVSGKGDKDRVLSIVEPVISAVQAIRPEGAGDDDFVFRGKNTKAGKPMSRVAVHQIVKAAGKRIGRDDVSAHWLRHSYATHALHAGATIDMIQRDLGHESVGTTGRYTHANPDDGAGRFLSVD